jgi:hypothetical protein
MIPVQDYFRSPKWPVVYLAQLLGLPWVAARMLMPFFVARAFAPPASLEIEGSAPSPSLWQMVLRRLSPFVFFAVALGLLLSLTSLIGQQVILNAMHREAGEDAEFRVFDWPSVIILLTLAPSYLLRMLALACVATLSRTFQSAMRAVYFLEFGVFSLCTLALAYAFQWTLNPLYLVPIERLLPALLFLAVLLPLASRAIHQRRTA